MSRKRILGSAALAAALSAGLALPPAPASAGADDFVGGLVGGAIGSVIGNAISRPRAEPQRERVIVREHVVRERAPRPAVNWAQREENRRIQTALNYFGFGAGAPDGILGRNSRSAIGAYQAFLGGASTGHLTAYETQYLLSSYDRAIAGGPQVGQLVAQYGQGPRGLLLAYQQPNPQIVVQTPPIVMQQPAPPMVIAAAQPPVVVQPQAPQVTLGQPPTTQVVVNNQPAAAAPQPTAAAPAPQPEVQVAAVQPAPSEPEPEAEPAPAMMPSFIGGAVEASMAGFCNKANLVSASNGGMISVASLPQADPTQALSEQFCLARTYAIDEGEKLSSSVQGVSLADMQAQCAAFAPSMRDYVAAMVAKRPDEATSDLQTFVIQTGMPPQQLAANSKICLGIGYRTDSADIALASALVLVGLGEAGYGEMLAHHMAQGFGAPKRLDRAADWYDHTVTALDAGAQRVVAPGMADRPMILRAAATRLRGGQASAAPPSQPAAVVPSFGMPAPVTPAQPVNN